jgi:uncharacterized LabA/DUF88 family protein
MHRTAIFVDAGYLFAQGSTALTSAKKPRSDLQLNGTAAIAELGAVVLAKTGRAELLRVYWYDGAIGFKGPTLEQTALAHMDNVKLRLGFVNSMGQQKGVDSLIVTDLIDLARNQAITDAVLLSGDEDVRIGVVIAQSFGVRVHLIGIHPSRGSQSKQLLQEADTTTEWDATTVAKFVIYKATAPIPTGPTARPGAAVPASAAAFRAVCHVTKSVHPRFCSGLSRAPRSSRRCVRRSGSPAQGQGRQEWVDRKSNRLSAQGAPGAVCQVRRADPLIGCGRVPCTERAHPVRWRSAKPRVLR